VRIKNRKIEKIAYFMKKTYSVITGTGSCVPTKRMTNNDFLSYEFYDANGQKFSIPNEEIVRKFEEITTISERRYAEDDQVTTDLALIAAQQELTRRSLIILFLLTTLVRHGWITSA
jgi:3-oxoacyl-[acyl-carrier-protein] synthase III